jgi:hypothetical protein
VTYPGARGGDSRTAANPNVRGGHEAQKPRRVGGLARDEPISLESIPCGAAGADVRACIGEAREGRRGEIRATPVRGNTLEGESPGELRALFGLNNRAEVADSRAEQTPEGGNAAEAAPYACQA